MDESRKISFKFHPRDMKNGLHAVVKSEGNQKRRYLVGISSGVQKDLHGERMTEKCIKSFQDQAETGDVLLYEGQHGVNFVDDIGKLVHSEILPGGDWLTEYRLYDELDGFSPESVTLEKADKLWKQVNGLAPYTKPKQKGFSIEGDVPDGGILDVDMSGKRVMNAVRLDGVVVVPRPAYESSIANSVYKALGEIPPEVADKLRDGMRTCLSEKIKKAEDESTFYQKKFMLDNGLEDEILEIMSDKKHGNFENKLKMLFDEYGSMMIPLILQNEGLFTNETREAAESSNGAGTSRRHMIMKEIESLLENLVDKRRSL